MYMSVLGCRYQNRYFLESKSLKGDDQEMIKEEVDITNIISMKSRTNVQKLKSWGHKEGVSRPLPCGPRVMVTWHDPCQTLPSHFPPSDHKCAFNQW